MLLTMNSGNTADTMHGLSLYACGWVLPALYSGKARADAGNESVNCVSFSRSDDYHDCLRGDLFKSNRVQNDSTATISGQFRRVFDTPFVLCKSWSGAVC